MIEIDLANVISAAGTVIAAFFAYNQYTRNKLTDLKVEQYKKDEERRGYRRSESTAKVFGELWRVLYELKADRVYIVQPHPLGHIAFLSVQFEVKRKGISPMIDFIQSLPMSELCVFSELMAKNVFTYITDIDAEVPDKRAKSLMMGNGTDRLAIKRLNNAQDWVGSIFVEWTDDSEVATDEQERIRLTLHEAAMNIQFILPEYKERKKEM